MAFATGSTSVIAQLPVSAWLTPKAVQRCNAPKAADLAKRIPLRMILVLMLDGGGLPDDHRRLRCP